MNNVLTDCVEYKKQPAVEGNITIGTAVNRSGFRSLISSPFDRGSPHSSRYGRSSSGRCRDKCDHKAYLFQKIQRLDVVLNGTVHSGAQISVVRADLVKEIESTRERKIVCISFW
ncbi:hypothetical protein TNCV_1980051 [Trichonephila clavipes]|nr:hypothetical protein TNCV_1980051 [Trichonephila clavipes]